MPSSMPIPAEVAQAFRAYRTCEFSTLARDGTPITWPTLPFWDEATGRFVTTTSIGLPQKVFNVRRDGRVALLFSDPTGSGLDAPPAVLVQGDAVAPDRLETSVRDMEAQLEEIFRRQPASALYSKNRLTQRLFDWYYMRLTITVTPRRIRWWEAGDFGRAPQELEVTHVD